jgi:hypothetical protein
MITEKEWDSPRFMPDSSQWQGWLAAWNSSGKNYPSSGLGRHNKYLPVLTAADGHVSRWRVPPYSPGATAPTFFPGLGDTRIDTSPYWTSPGPDYYMRDFAAANNGF